MSLKPRKLQLMRETLQRVTAGLNHRTTHRCHENSYWNTCLDCWGETYGGATCTTCEGGGGGYTDGCGSPTEYPNATCDYATQGGNTCCPL